MTLVVNNRHRKMLFTNGSGHISGTNLNLRLNSLVAEDYSSIEYFAVAECGAVLDCVAALETARSGYSAVATAMYFARDATVRACIE